MPESEPLKIDEKALRGGLWLLSLRISTRLLGFVRSVILARLLTPADFGLVGMAMLVIAVLDIVTQTGFDTALIQRKDPTERLINTAWTLQAMRGIILFFIAFFLAPWAAQFFTLPSLDLVIRFIAVSLIVTGVRNVGIIFFQKELRFDQSFKFEMVSSLVDLVVSVSLAFIFKDAWALVWGGLAGNLTRLIMSYLIHPYRPRFLLAADHLKTILNFGKWILFTGIFYALQGQIETLTIGKVLGATEVGLYQMAMTLATIATTEISYIIRQVTFPTYSLLQNNLSELKNSYLTVLKGAAVICFPIGCTIITTTDDLVLALFGPKWIGLVPCLKVLVIAGILSTIGRLGYPVFLALGHPKYETLFQALNLTVIISLILPLTKAYGIEGTAWSLVAGSMVVFLFSLPTLKRLISLCTRLYSKILTIPASSTAIMAVVILASRPYLKEWNIFLRLGVEIALGFIVYGIALYVIGKKSGLDLIRPFADKIKIIWTRS